MKKIIVWMLIFVILLSCVPSVSIIYAKEADVSVAKATFGKRLDLKGFSTAFSGEAPYVSEKDNRGCWILDSGNSKNFKLGLVFDGNFKPEKFDGSEYEVQIDYYDGGNGFFRLMYDEYNTLFDNCAGFTYVTDDKVWKTAVYTLANAEFMKGVDGLYDLMIAIDCPMGASNHQTSASSIAIGEVRVIRRPAKNKLFISTVTGQDGNIYEWYKESKILNNTYENLSQKDINAVLKHKLSTDEGLIVFEKEEHITVQAGGKKEAELDFGEVKRCDIYNYEVTVTSDDGEISSTMMPMQLSVLKTDPDGIVNKDQYWAAHLNYFTEATVSDDQRRADIADKAVRVMKKANSGGIRSDICWEEFEQQPGVYGLKERYINELEAAKKHGLGFIPQLNTAHWYYTGRYDVYSQTDEQFNALAKATEWFAKEYGDYFAAYEILNEPTIRSFNRYFDTWAGPELCMKNVNVVAEALKKGDPDKFVWGVCMCELMMERAQTYFKAMVETGEFDKYIDGLSLHPYALDVPEIYRIYDWYIKPYYIDVLEENGIHDMPIFFSEVGYPNTFDTVGSSEAKGWMMQRNLIYFKTIGIGTPLAYYNFEHKGPIETNTQDMYGSVSSGYDHTMKWGEYFVPDISYVMTAGTNYALAESEVLENLNNEEKNIWLTRYKSNKFNTNIVTLYSVQESKNVTLNLGAEKVTVYDHLGNSNEIYGKDGVFTFRSEDKPKYIVGDIKSVNILEESHVLKCTTMEIDVPRNDYAYVEVYNYLGEDCAWEVVTPSNVEVVDVTADNADKTKSIIKLKNNAEIGEEIPVVINLKQKDGKIMGSTEVNIISKEQIISSLSVELASQDNINQWRGRLSIKNNSSSRPIKGKVIFTNPSELASKSEIDIGVITKGREGEITFNIPSMQKKGRKFAAYDIYLDSGEVVHGTQNFDTSLATYAETKPLIDGVISPGEWNTNSAMYSDTAVQAIPLAGQKWDWGGVNDCSGRSVVEWDEENIYIMAVVTDNIFKNTYTADTLWMGDSMQFGISYGDDGYVAIGQSYSTFHEIGMALLPEGSAAYRFMSQEGGNYSSGVVEAAEVCVKRSGTKTIYEFKMPWSKLLNPGQTVNTGSSLQYSFLFNDNDGKERVGYMECGSGIGTNKDSRQFMTLKFIK